MRLQGKTALITGGATGIGEAIALAYAREGCRVAISGRREDALRAVANAYDGSPKIIFHPCDVADRNSVIELFRWAKKELGHIDILVNSAGINVKKRGMAESLPEEWDQILAVNATGAFNCFYEVLPQMRERKDGLIINISSIAGKRSSRLGGVAYSASKFAMSALGTAAAIEEGKNGIRVTNIYPGEVDTPILKNRPTPVSDEHRARILQAEDVAAAALMIALLPPRAHVQEMVIKPTLQEYS